MCPIQNDIEIMGAIYDIYSYSNPVAPLVISSPNFQFDMAFGGDLDPLPAVRPRPRAGVHGQPEAVRDQGDHQHVQRRPGGLQCLLPARLLDERLGIVL